MMLEASGHGWPTNVGVPRLLQPVKFGEASPVTDCLEPSGKFTCLQVGSH